MNSDQKSRRILSESAKVFDLQHKKSEAGAADISEALGVSLSQARLIYRQLNGMEYLLEEIGEKLILPPGMDATTYAGDITKTVFSPGSSTNIFPEDTAQVSYAYAYFFTERGIQNLKQGSIIWALDNMVGTTRFLVAAVERASEESRTRNAQAAAEAKHGAPGGSRSKQEQIRRAWASGKYTSRDRCAEEECGAIGMSFSAARKALRNTPEST